MYRSIRFNDFWEVLFVKNKRLFSLLMILCFTISSSGINVYAGKYNRIEDVPGYHLQTPTERDPWLPYCETIDFMFYNENHTTSPDGQFCQTTILNLVKPDKYYHDDNTGKDYCMFSDRKKTDLMNNGYKFSIKELGLCLPSGEERPGYTFLGYNTNQNATTAQQYFTEQDYGKKFYQIFVKNSDSSQSTTQSDNANTTITSNAQHEEVSDTASTDSSQDSVATNPETGENFTEKDVNVCYIQIIGDDAQSAMESVGADSKNTIVYDISISDADGNLLQVISGQKIRVSLPIPKKVPDGAVFTVFHIKRNGKTEKMSVTVSQDQISFDSNDFSPYVITWAVSEETPTENISAPATSSMNNITIVGITAAMVTMIGMICAAVIIKKKAS